MIESLAEGIVVQDPAGRILDCNPAAAKALGYTPEQLLGQLLPGELLHFSRDDGSALPPEEHPSRVVLKTRRAGRQLLAYDRKARNSLPPERCWLRVTTLPLTLVSGTPPAGVITSFVEVPRPSNP